MGLCKRYRILALPIASQKNPGLKRDDAVSRDRVVLLAVRPLVRARPNKLRDVDGRQSKQLTALAQRIVTSTAGRNERPRLFVDLFLEAQERAPNEIILDLDATDDPVQGAEGRFFHDYYDCYCYLPLYVFCARHLLAAKLRRANIDAAAGAVEEVARISGTLGRPLRDLGRSKSAYVDPAAALSTGILRLREQAEAAEAFVKRL